MIERITDERLKRIIGIYEDLYVSETPADYEIELVAKELAILRNQQRKRPPSEKPGGGEVVLVSMKDGLTLGFYHHTKGRWLGIPGLPLLEEDRIQCWWPIKHLLEAGGAD